jgi:hypothetical protein
MAAQLMKASHNGWVDFTKGLVKLPPSTPPHAADTGNKHSEARREGGRMEGLRLAIAGLPMSVLTLAAVPALAQTNPNMLADLPTTSDQLSLVDSSPSLAEQTQPASAQATPSVKMISVAQTGNVFAPSPDGIHSRSAFTYCPAKSASSCLPGSQAGIALMAGAGGLALLRRRSPIK